MRHIDHKHPAVQIQGLKWVSELLNNCGSIKQFSESYLQDKDNLAMVMKKIMDENQDVKEEAFQLLIIYLFTPRDMKSDDVNDILSKNSEKLAQVIEDDLLSGNSQVFYGFFYVV